MKNAVLGAALAATVLAGCGRNEPGTMGGEPGVPPSASTGAPAEAAKESAVSEAQGSAMQSEQGSSTFDGANETNSRSDLLRPDASTAPPGPLNPNSPNRATR